MKDFFYLLRRTKFPFIWISQILSQMTVNVMTFLILVRLFEKTGSTIATSFVWIANSLPAMIIGPFAAASVDIFNKRKMLMITNLLQAFVIFIYAILYKRYFYLSYGVIIAYSFLNQFYIPAETSTIPSVVPKKFLARANSLFFITEQSSVIIGFSLAGIIAEVIGYQRAFLLASAFLLLAFISVNFLPDLKSKIVQREIERKVADFFGTIIQGYKFIKDNRRVLYPFLFLVCIQVCLAISAVNLPVLATDIIKIPAARSGIMVVLPTGLGAFFSALLTPHLLDLGLRKKRIIESSLLGATLAIWGLVLIVPNLPLWIGKFLATICFILAGMSFVSIVVPSLTFLQEVTPGGLMGRVFGNFWFITTSATVLPVLFSATITDLFGVKAMFTSLGAFSLALFVISVAYTDRLLRW